MNWFIVRRERWRRAVTRLIALCFTLLVLAALTVDAIAKPGFNSGF
jgi:hypothetical protein